MRSSPTLLRMKGATDAALSRPCPRPSLRFTSSLTHHTRSPLTQRALSHHSLLPVAGVRLRCGCARRSYQSQSPYPPSSLSSLYSHSASSPFDPSPHHNVAVMSLPLTLPPRLLPLAHRLSALPRLPRRPSVARLPVTHGHARHHHSGSNDVVVIGDGQVTLGSTVVKPNARKVRVIGGGKVIAGFAGSTADCFALLEALEKKLDEFPAQLLRAGVELAKAWRMDRHLRHLEATVVAVDKDMSITLTGNGDVISEPENGVIGIGSGGLYAVSAARALVDFDGLSARQVAIRAMDIAADVCIYTNRHFVVEAFERGQLLTGKDKAAREAEDRQHRDAQAASRKVATDKVEQQRQQQLKDEGTSAPNTIAQAFAPPAEQNSGGEKADKGNDVKLSQ